MSRRTLAALLLLGAALRIVLLPLPGTIDVQTQKMWSHGASTDVTGIYGVGGTPTERRMVEWLDISGPVDYPPLALLELAVVGRVYGALDPAYPDSTLLTVLVKSPGLAAEALFVAVLLRWGRRWLGDDPAQWAALAVWLSPAIWLSGAALGYVDAQGAVPGALAAIAACAGRPGLAGALVAVAAGTKPQNVFLLPVVVVVVLRLSGRAGLMRAALGGAAVTALVVGPFVLRGATDNMLLGVSRLLHHNMLSATAPNVWWIVTWILRVWYAVPDLGWGDALTLQIRILQISRVIELGYPNPRVIGTALTLAAAAAAAWRAWLGGVSLPTAAALAAWTIYAYSMLGVAVHENHFYPAVPLFAIAAARIAPLRRVFWITSAIFALNLYLFYGLSRGWPPLIGRGWTGLDLTVLLAVANTAVFAWTTHQVWRASARRVLPEEPRDRMQRLDVIAD